MWEYTYTDELCHYGVKGMKWGVRKAAKAKLSAARARRDEGISNAKSEKDVMTAKSKYKLEKKKIKLDAKMKIREINKSPEGIQAGREAAAKALSTTGKIAGVAVAAIAVTPAVQLGWGVYRMYRGW